MKKSDRTAACYLDLWPYSTHLSHAHSPITDVRPLTPLPNGRSPQSVGSQLVWLCSACTHTATGCRNLHGALIKIPAQADVKERFDAQGLETMTMASSEAYGKFLKDEIVRWSKVAQSAGIKAQ